MQGERENYFIKPRTHNEFSLTDYGLPSEIRDLAGGTSFVQRITVTFDTATNTKSGAKEYVRLEPPFVLRYQRSWVSSRPKPVDELNLEGLVEPPPSPFP